MSSSIRLNGKGGRRRAVESSDPELTIGLWSRPGYLIRRLHQLSVAVFLDEMADLNLTPLQLGALSIIADSPGIDQATIAEQLGVDRVTAGDVIARLEKNDLAIRQVSPRDKRYKEVFLTDEGRALAKAGAARLAQVQERLLGSLDSKQRKLFLDLVRALITANEREGRLPRDAA